MSGMLVELQRLIDEEYRKWSGVDDRDPRLIYLKDLPLTNTNQSIGDHVLDLRSVRHEWIFQAFMAWAKATPRGPSTLALVAGAWNFADEVLASRRTPPQALGTGDMSAIIDAIRERWPAQKTQRRYIGAIARIIQFARAEEGLQELWRSIPAQFSVDPERHRARRNPDEADPNPDEPFRFVPQPIVDWVMDHLHLLERRDEYSTAEARVMIFVHERCGRRTGETLRLLDDCISYDSQGSPYLEWQQGKAPYARGKRLPIHQETHDVIRQWQEIKREHGGQSKWLFPSLSYSSGDRPYRSNFLADRVNELTRLVALHSPYSAPVEGAEGNLIYFDLSTIDPYSFRHAFAQRLADATDEEGRSTTPPDVLQDYMGHKSFTTTMVYYQVTAKRRKKALESIAPRRLNLHGKAVEVDRERDGFGKIAVTLGHCSEPQNVAASGHSCALEHSCESCPFFLVDPLERDGMVAKRDYLRVKLERARVIDAPQHMLDHYAARAQNATTIIDGIDEYVAGLPEDERRAIADALDRMAETRRRATASRNIDVRELLRKAADDGK